MPRLSTAAALLAVAAVLATGAATRPDQVTPAPAASISAPCSYPHQTATWDAHEPARRAIVVGDSMAGQLVGVTAAAAAQRCHDVTVWALSGKAPCDFLPTYGATLSESGPSGLRLSRVAVDFVGNATSPCMLAALGWTDRGRPPATLTAADVQRVGSVFARDVDAMIRWNLAHNLQTVLMLPPKMGPGTWHGQVNAELVARLTALGDQYGGVWTSSAVRDAVGGDTYRATISGQPARHTDGTHFAAPGGTGPAGMALATAATR